MAGMTIAYKHPVTGAVAPTALQAKNLVIATAACGAGVNDDATDIVHNLGTSAAGADGFPVVTSRFIAQGASAKTPTITVKDANTLTVTAAVKGAGCDFTVEVAIMRPHTIVQ